MKLSIRVRAIKGFPGYFISELGDVYSENGKTPVCRISPSTNRNGYLSVILRDDNKRKTMMVHRIVAKAFVNGENETVNHINGLKWDNRASNLEWRTQRENIRHHFRALKKNVGDEHWNTKIPSSETVKMTKRYKAGESIVSIAAGYGVKDWTVGRRLQAAGVQIRKNQRKSFIDLKKRNQE